MKKVALILMSFVCFQLAAQDKPSQRKNQRNPRVENRMKITPEESATLQSKRLTLQLDLSETQQAKVKSLLFEDAKYRENMRAEYKNFIEENKSDEPKNEALIKEKRLEIMNARLDRQIKMKANMKEILDPAQYEKWESNFMKPKRGKRGKKGTREKSKTR